MRRTSISFPVLFIFTALFPLGASENVSLNGYFKGFFMAFHFPAYKTDSGTLREPDLGAVNNRLRLKVSLKPVKWLGFELAYDFSPRVQDPKLFIGERVFQPHRPGELQNRGFI